MLKGCITAKIDDFEIQGSENAKYCYPASELTNGIEFILYFST